MEIKEIHSDFRGKIYIMTGALIDYPEITIMKTNKGYARGGCIHNDHDEFVCVLEGMIKYVYCDIKIEKILTDGDSLLIPRATPHYFYSITDSIVMEWGADPEEKKAKHKEFRTIVDSINMGNK